MSRRLTNCQSFALMPEPERTAWILHVGGLVRFWAKDIKVGFADINAKAEGIEARPAFREAFQQHRCLMTCWPVSPRVNGVKNNDPSLVELSPPSFGARPNPGKPMRIRLATISTAFTIGLAALPLSTVKAQPYPPQYYPCSPFLLAWPFCVAGAIVGTAAMIVTAPLWVLTGPPPAYYWPPLYRPPPPPYFPPGYRVPPNYYGSR